MRSDKPISHLMSRNPVALKPDDRPSYARKLMQTHGIHHLPVVEERRFIGLVSANDLLRVSFGDTYKQDPQMIDAVLDTMTMREVMQEDVITVQHDEPIQRAAELLADGSFHSLPVLQGEILVGMITSTDLIGELLAAYGKDGSGLSAAGG